MVTVRGPAGEARTDVTIPVAEPGWTAYLVPHFHYDPVWWTTQAAYTEAWDETTGPDSARQAFQLAGFDLVRAHLETARHDPDYRFVLAETDYLKPWWDTVPAERAFLRRLLAEGRCELVGGTYNEPNTNLTAVESTIRNLAYGIALQRDVLGGNPETAWQLDAFGHDPQFPGLCAGAGLTASSWARGPFHQWGPIQTHGGYGDARVMQFPSEFEWVAPSGTGLLTAYMPAHYSAGWWMDSAPTLAEAEAAVHDLFRVAQAGGGDPQRADPGGYGLLAAEQVGHRDPPGLERPLHLAAVRLRGAAGLPRRGAGRAGRRGPGRRCR